MSHLLHRNAELVHVYPNLGERQAMVERRFTDLKANRVFRKKADSVL